MNMTKLYGNHFGYMMNNNLLSITKTKQRAVVEITSDCEEQRYTIIVSLYIADIISVLYKVMISAPSHQEMSDLESAITDLLKNGTQI